MKKLLSFLIIVFIASCGDNRKCLKSHIEHECQCVCSADIPIPINEEYEACDVYEKQQEE